MPFSFVSYYGKKEPLLASILSNLQDQILDILDDRFRPYSLEQIHGTIIGLETIKIHDQIFGKWCDNQGKAVQTPVDQDGLLRFLAKEAPVKYIRIGGFQVSHDYGFLSREQHPHFRSFSAQNNIVVLNCWPVVKQASDWVYTADLYSWRKSFEHFNICHKWNTKDNQDNDLFMVLGKVEASWISPEEIDNLCHQLRAFLSREMAIIPLTQKQLMLVDYQDTELPLSNTRIYPIDQSSYRFLENITL